MTTVCINLLPSDIILSRRAGVRKRRWIVACAALSLAGVVSSIAVRATLRDPRGLADEFARAGERREEAAQELDRARASLRNAQQRLDAVGGLADRPDWSILLKVIAGARTESTVVDAVGLKKAPPAPPPAGATSTVKSDDGAFDITIKGRGENQRDITALALRLEQTGLFDSVRQERVQASKSEAKDLLEFEFSCRLGPRPVNRKGNP